MLRAARPALLATAVAALALPAAASGGAYTAVQCNQGLSPTPGQAVSEQTNISGYTLSAGCDSGAGLQVKDDLLVASPNAAYGRWVWRAPTGTVFTNIQAAASLVDGSAGERARLVAVQAGGQTVDFGIPGSPWQAYQVSGEFSAIRSQVRCDAAGQCPILAIPQAQAAIRDVAVRIDDTAKPVAAFTGGSLFTGDAVRGFQRASFQVADDGGGVRELELRVNDELVYSNVRDCLVSFGVATALQPCAAQADVTTTLPASSEPFATGVNEITACGSDLALEGLPNRNCQSREVFVDDLCPTSDVGAGSELNASFGGGKKTARVRSNQRPNVNGTLTTNSGDGIADAKVCALTRVKLAGEPYEVADVAKTRSDGSYKLRLPAGASREVFVDRVFGDEVLMRAGLETAASVRPSFEVKPNKKRQVTDGQRLRFRGELPGPGCGGQVIKVQAKIGKRRWQVFRSVRTNDDCVYKTRYKLRSTSRSTRYLFRVRVPEQGDYPYAAGSSTVRVRRAGPGRR